MKSKLSKKDDHNWCMQFGGLLMGLLFITVGVWKNPEFLLDLKERAYIYMGFVWLVLGLVHRMNWNHKVAMEKVSQAGERR